MIENDSKSLNNIVKLFSGEGKPRVSAKDVEKNGKRKKKSAPLRTLHSELRELRVMR